MHGQVRRWKFVRVFGLGALVAGAATLAIWLAMAAVFIGPLVFWFAWNGLDPLALDNRIHERPTSSEIHPIDFDGQVQVDGRIVDLSQP